MFSEVSNEFRRVSAHFAGFSGGLLDSLELFGEERTGGPTHYRPAVNVPPSREGSSRLRDIPRLTIPIFTGQCRDAMIAGPRRGAGTKERSVMYLNKLSKPISNARNDVKNTTAVP